MNCDIIFSDIIERDVDFALIRSFLDYESVRDLFFSQIQKYGDVIKVYHSLNQFESDGHVGESDIVFILENEKEKFAIFIENKINADPQPFQRLRYDDRAKLFIKTEGCNEYFVFLSAPQIYKSTSKADGYEYFVSYENINKLIDEDDFDKCIFDYSCNEKKQKYSVIRNDAVTEFWNKLYKHIEDNYCHLKINKNFKPRGSKADWVTFRTSVKGVYIVWKSTIKWNRVDLEFSGMAAKKELFNSIIRKLEVNNYEPIQVSKSMALTIKLPLSCNVSFMKSFDEQLLNVNKFLDAVLEFDKLANKLFYLGITNLYDLE